MDENGIVHTFDDELAGEAWPGGPVILSWADVGLAERGYNVVIHEFAHKIHMDGAGDADFPAARAGMDAAEWRRSEEHTSELQSQSNLVCRLLLEKKKNTCVQRDTK